MVVPKRIVAYVLFLKASHIVFKFCLIMVIKSCLHHSEMTFYRKNLKFLNKYCFLAKKMNQKNALRVYCYKNKTHFEFFKKTKPS